MSSWQMKLENNSIFRSSKENMRGLATTPESWKALRKKVKDLSRREGRLLFLD
jgi:hypothetical protein